MVTGRDVSATHFTGDGQSHRQRKCQPSLDLPVGM